MGNRNAYFTGDFHTRTGLGAKYIEGYFAVFNQRTELWEGFFEEIDPGAFDNSLKNNDIRCLFNHNTDIVLGRTGNRTLELRTDAHGLFGTVKINEDDKQALDIYARVQRGDIDGCSFGFNPIREECTKEAGGSVVYRIMEADTGEVSICVFPAYPQTEIQARHRDFEVHTAAQNASDNQQRLERIKQRLEKWKC